MLAIDFGTSRTAAAVRWLEEDSVRVLQLGQGGAAMPSGVLVSGGRCLAGPGLELDAQASPGSYVAQPKDGLGDQDAGIFTDGTDVSAVDLVAAVLRFVADRARREHAGTSPALVRLTHPVAWGPPRTQLLRDAALHAGLDGPLDLVVEPVAAAAAMLAGREVPEGQFVAVYDFGGGTFDAAVLRRAGAGFVATVGQSGDAQLGGARIDHAIFERVLAHLGTNSLDLLNTEMSAAEQLAYADLRLRVRAAKETLSFREQTGVPIPAPLRSTPAFTLTADELDKLVADDVTTTLDRLAVAIRSAGLQVSDVHTVYAIGGSSQLRAAQAALREAYDGRLLTVGDPKTVVAAGAAGLPVGPVQVPPIPEREIPQPPPGPVPEDAATGWGMPVRVGESQALPAASGDLVFAIQDQTKVSSTLVCLNALGGQVCWTRALTFAADEVDASPTHVVASGSLGSSAKPGLALFLADGTPVACPVPPVVHLVQLGTNTLWVRGLRDAAEQHPDRAEFEAWLLRARLGPKGVVGTQTWALGRESVRPDSGTSSGGTLSWATADGDSVFASTSFLQAKRSGGGEELWTGAHLADAVSGELLVNNKNKVDKPETILTAFAYVPGTQRRVGCQPGLLAYGQNKGNELPANTEALVLPLNGGSFLVAIQGVEMDESCRVLLMGSDGASEPYNLIEMQGALMVHPRLFGSVKCSAPPFAAVGSTSTWVSVLSAEGVSTWLRLDHPAGGQVSIGDAISVEGYEIPLSRNSHGMTTMMIGDDIGVICHRSYDAVPPPV
ncbi:MAG: Hsp70 family protein [Actinomycetota bacterium]|nr:Hsp70 family protein [Actinomycetota bacterium]